MSAVFRVDRRSVLLSSCAQLILLGKIHIWDSFLSDGSDNFLVFWRFYPIFFKSIFEESDGSSLKLVFGWAQALQSVGNLLK